MRDIKRPTTAELAWLTANVDNLTSAEIAWLTGEADCAVCDMPFCDMPFCDVHDTLYVRLTGGFELVVSRPGSTLGDVCEPGQFGVKLYQFGNVIHEIPAFVRLSPATHLDVARSAVETFKACGIVPDDARQV